jgi:hypothetical protein
VFCAGYCCIRQRSALVQAAAAVLTALLLLLLLSLSAVPTLLLPLGSAALCSVRVTAASGSVVLWYRRLLQC